MEKMSRGKNNTGISLHSMASSWMKGHLCYRKRKHVDRTVSNKTGLKTWLLLPSQLHQC